MEMRDQDSHIFILPRPEIQDFYVNSSILQMLVNNLIENKILGVQ